MPGPRTAIKRSNSAASAASHDSEAHVVQSRTVGRPEATQLSSSPVIVLSEPPGHGSCPRTNGFTLSVPVRHGSRGANSAAATVPADHWLLWDDGSGSIDESAGAIGVDPVDRTAPQPGSCAVSLQPPPPPPRAHPSDAGWLENMSELTGHWHSSGLPRRAGQKSRVSAALASLRAPRDLRPHAKQD